MGYGKPDVYYNPEMFDLTILSSADVADSYEFDMIVVWKHADGRFFIGNDSGCSCPSPFENFDSLDELTEVTNLAEIAEFARDAWCYHSTSELNEGLADLLGGLRLQ